MSSVKVSFDVKSLNEMYSLQRQYIGTALSYMPAGLRTAVCKELIAASKQWGLEPMPVWVDMVDRPAYWTTLFEENPNEYIIKYEELSPHFEV